LVGDGSDDIPGVPGIGPKCAIQILLEFKTLEGALSAAKQSKLKVVDLIGPKRCQAMADMTVVKGVRQGRRVIQLERSFNGCDALSDSDWKPGLSWRRLRAELLGRKSCPKARAQGLGADVPADEAALAWNSAPMVLGHDGG